MKSRITLLLAFVTLGLMEANAQEASADFFRSIGKIYVVIAVMVITFIGIIAFLVYIERKIKKIENEVSSHK